VFKAIIMSVSAQARPVDLVHLSRYTGGDPALNAEILQLFSGQAADLMLKLQAVLEARDLKGWKDITHSLKGAARGIGAFAMADAASNAEPALPAPDNTAAIRALQELKREAEAVQLFIGAYLSPKI
jgi:HPt (histidine-containing phosphotransfer) domain-containing protein